MMILDSVEFPFSLVGSRCRYRSISHVDCGQYLIRIHRVIDTDSPWLAIIIASKIDITSSIDDKIRISTSKKIIPSSIHTISFHDSSQIERLILSERDIFWRKRNSRPIGINFFMNCSELSFLETLTVSEMTKTHKRIEYSSSFIMESIAQFENLEKSHRWDYFF